MSSALRALDAQERTSRIAAQTKHPFRFELSDNQIVDHMFCLETRELVTVNNRKALRIPSTLG